MKTEPYAMALVLVALAAVCWASYCRCRERFTGKVQWDVPFQPPLAPVATGRANTTPSPSA